MATTTNYSWSTPDDTALVKDGAAAIRSLGTAIDSTVFTNAGAAIAKATVDAKGDLIAGTADNTVARLAVGANNTILVADSSTATGLKWAAPASGGGLTLLSTTSLSGATTTVTISDSSYINLFVVAYRVSNDTNNGDFRLKLNSDTSMVQADIYRFSSTTGTGGVGGGFLNLTNGNGIVRTNNDNYFAINIYNYASAAQYKAFDFRGIFTSTQSGNPVTVEFGAGGYPTNTAITSLIFENSNGNLNGGTVLVYGVK
jgi:hypothetical protein